MVLITVIYLNFKENINKASIDLSFFKNHFKKISDLYNSFVLEFDLFLKHDELSAVNLNSKFIVNRFSSLKLEISFWFI